MNASALDALALQAPLQLAPPDSDAMNVPLLSRPCGKAQSVWDVGALTRAIRRGDEIAFDAFYERYCDRFYRLLLALTRGDEHNARDVLQTVMIKLARRLPVMEREGELWSWLAHVARNALVDHLRHTKPGAEKLSETTCRNRIGRSAMRPCST